MRCAASDRSTPRSSCSTTSVRSTWRPPFATTASSPRSRRSTAAASTPTRPSRRARRSDRIEAQLVTLSGNEVPGRRQHDRHAAAQPGPAPAGRGAASHRRQSARLPARRRDRADGGQRQRRARRSDGQARRCRRTAPHPRPDSARTSRDVDRPRRGRYPLPEAGCTLVRVEPGQTHTSTGHELTVGLDGRTLYLAPGTSFTPTTTTFVVTPHPE